MNNPNFKGPIVALEYQWWGVAIGGRHYTGSIRADGKTIELTRKLSGKEAKLYAEESGRLWHLREKETNKFESFDQMKRFAVKWCQKNLPEDWLCLEHDIHNCNLPVGAGGKYKEKVKMLTMVAKKWAKVTNHQRTDEMFDKFDNLWQTILK